MKDQTLKEVNQSFILKKIKDLFITIISKLKENSYYKNKLLSNFKFISNILFHKLDFFSKKSIITKDLIYYLTQHNIKFSEEIIRRLITQYDKHGNLNLIYDDFTKMISPYNNRINNNNTNDNSGNTEVPDEIFCNILINELKLIENIQGINLLLRKNNNFNSYKIFKEINGNEQNLNKEILNNFLDKKFSDLDIEQLVYYLDRNNDGLISYEDFRDLLRPIGGDIEFNEYDEIKEKNKKEVKINNIAYQNNKHYIDGNNDNNNDINNNSLPISSIPKTNDLSENNSNNNSSDNVNLEDNNEKDNVNNGENYKNNIIRSSDENMDKEKEYLYEKYLYTDNYDIIINDEQNENYDYSNINTMNNFVPKILKEEKEDILNIKGPTFTFGNKLLINNTQSKNGDNAQDNNDYKENDDDNVNIENQISLQNNIYDNGNNNLNSSIEQIQNQFISQSPLNPEENFEIYDNFENNIIKNGINDNIAVPKFPMQFENNKENNIINQNVLNEIDNINKSKNENYKEEMNYYFCKYLNQNNNNNYQPFNNNLKNGQEFNNSPNLEEIPKNSYFYPVKQNLNINNNKYEENGNNEQNNYYYQEYPNKAKAINVFLEYINLIIFNENKLEHLKENLILREDLTLKEIFSLFDKEQNGYISIKNFQFICKKIFNLYPTSDQIKLVYKRYKKQLNNDKKDKFDLNIYDFIYMMSPSKCEYSNIINNKNRIDKTNIKLSIKSKNILIELIKCLLQKETDYYKIKRKLNDGCLEFIWKEILKYSKKEKINKKQFKMFLEEYGYILYDKQINNIFLIFDKSNKGVIKHNDFFEEMLNF